MPARGPTQVTTAARARDVVWRHPPRRCLRWAWHLGSRFGSSGLVPVAHDPPRLAFRTARAAYSEQCAALELQPIIPR